MPQKVSGAQMAVKAVLLTLEGVAAELAKEYKKGPDGNFYLDLEGVDDHPSVGELRRAKQHEVDNRKTAEDETRKAKEEARTLREQLETRLKGKVDKTDLEALQKSYDEKAAKDKAEWEAERAGLQSSLQKVTVDREAQRIASEVALGKDEIAVLLPHIRPRLKVEVEKGEAVIKVLGQDLKPSAASLDDLQKEIVATPMFAKIIKGSKASGSGASGAGSGSGAPLTKLDTKTASAADLVALIDAKKGQGG